MSCTKYIRLSIITIIILFICSLWDGNLTASAAVQFDDLQGHWAIKAISRAAALDLISGYPEGQFKPDNEISQIETLVLFMRLKASILTKRRFKRKTIRNPACRQRPR